MSDSMYTDQNPSFTPLTRPVNPFLVDHHYDTARNPPAPHIAQDEERMERHEHAGPPRTAHVGKYDPEDVWYRLRRDDPPDAAQGHPPDAALDRDDRLAGSRMPTREHDEWHHIRIRERLARIAAQERLDRITDSMPPAAYRHPAHERGGSVDDQSYMPDRTDRRTRRHQH